MLTQSNIFIVGIKGAAMANVARILSQMGNVVTGSDTEESFITDEVLQKSKIRVINSFKAEDLPQNTELVIYSAAHVGKDSAQVREGLRRGIQVKHQAEVLGEILKEFKTSVAVCGCHGKTTTTALLAYVLKNLQVNPSYLVGTSGFNDSTGGEYAGKDYFVIEADEYGVNPPVDKTPKLHFLQPTHAICTNIDYDHPDVYENIEQVKETFKKFFKKVISHSEGKQRLYFCEDDQNLIEVANSLSRESYLTYGFSDQADLQIMNVKNDEEMTTFRLKNNKIATLTSLAHNDEYDYSVSLFGEKNISNTAGVISFLLTQGYSAKDINDALQGFTGAKRRFELVAKVNDSCLFDDYAHHPEEIQATIKAARMRFPKRRIVLIFQPHTYSRTESLKEQFVEALSQADEVLIAQIFPSAREKVESAMITSKDLAELARQKNISNIQGFTTKEDLLFTIKNELNSGDVVFTMGAGDIYKLKDDIIKLLENA